MMSLTDYRMKYINEGMDAIISEYQLLFDEKTYKSTLRNFSRGETSFYNMTGANKRKFIDLLITHMVDKGNKAYRNTTAISKDERKMERVWYTKNGRFMGISYMDDDHLHNTILMVDRGIAEGWTKIGANENLANLLDELEEERIHRGLHMPLVPFKSLKYRKGIHDD